MTKIHDMTNVRDYSVAYDRIMNTNFELVKGVYDRMGELSFSVDPKYTYKKSVSCGVNGYTHPVHNTWVDEILENMGIEKNALIDDPRHDNKLRYFFKDYEEAVAALYMVKKYVNEGYVCRYMARNKNQEVK